MTAALRLLAAAAGTNKVRGDAHEGAVNEAAYA